MVMDDSSANTIKRETGFKKEGIILSCEEEFCVLKKKESGVI